MINNLNNKISVIIPCYNSEKTIRESLCSFYHQTIPLKEIVIVDDNSNDETLKIVREMAVNSIVPVKIIEHQVNMGQGAARHTGVLHSSGEYIIQADSDAYYSANYCIKLIRQIEGKRKSMSFGGLRVCWGESNGFWKVFWDAYFVARWKLLKDKKVPLIGAWAFCREDYIQSGGYSSILRQGEDADLLTRLERDGFSNHWTPYTVMTHLEPQTFHMIFKRFIKSSETVEVRANNHTLKKTFIGSVILVSMVLSGTIVFFAPILLFFVKDLNFGFTYLLFREKRLFRAICFPYQYFFFRFCSAWGILCGIGKYVVRQLKRHIRKAQTNIFYKFNEKKFRAYSLLKSEHSQRVPILASFDDFSPAQGGKDWLILSDGSFVNPCLLKIFEDNRLRLTMFSVAAMYYNNKYWDVRKYPEWLTLVKKYTDISEVALHGYDHFNPKSSTKMVEFKDMSISDIERRMNESMRIWHSLNIPIYGIRPPGWGVGRNDALISIAVKMKLLYGSFSTINDGMNRIFKRTSNLYPIRCKGIINIPQNIGIWDNDIDEKIRYLVQNEGVISLKFHYGDYAYLEGFSPSDRLTENAFIRLMSVTDLIEKVIFCSGRKPHYCTHIDFVKGYL